MSAPPRPPTHSNGPEPPALGSNPFDSAAGPDPFVEELERLGLETPTAAPAGTAADAPPRDRALDLDDDDAGPDWRSAPPLSELHDSEPPIGIESFVPAEVMQRVGALAYLVDIWAGSLPWVNVLYARGGQVIGTRENCADLLNEGQLLLVFPEGVAGVRKTIAERYPLRSFRVGFVEQAIAARAPVVPVAVIGSENQMPVLFNFEGIAKRLGLPAFPITPTFPWLGPLGLLPYPVSYRIVYGEPLHLAERFDDPSQVQPDDIRSLSMEVQQVVQELIDRNR
jgi:hypothetical protein